MNVIAQTASEMHDVLANIRVLAAAGAEAIYHHGTQTDKFWREGRIDDCLPYLRWHSRLRRGRRAGHAHS